MKRAEGVPAARPAHQPGGGGSTPTSALQAHQRKIRDREAASDTGGLFGRYWEELDLDIGKAVVREIDVTTATAVIERYEWLGTMPAIVQHCFGIYFDGALGGAVVYGPEYAENLGVWDRYDYTGKIIALLRGACVHWAHPHAASKLIRTSMRLLPEQYRVVTATVDAMAGEVGTIYQACGFDYVGVMSAGGRAAMFYPDGSRGSGRQMKRTRHDTRGAAALKALGVNAEAVARRGRYFGFRGDRREVAALREPICRLIKPYPKRPEKGS